MATDKDIRKSRYLNWAIAAVLAPFYYTARIYWWFDERRNRPPVCPYHGTPLYRDAHRVRCEEGCEFGLRGWGCDMTKLPTK